MNDPYDDDPQGQVSVLGNPARGCGKRRRGKTYLVTKLSKDGSPFEDFLVCPPRRVTPEEQRALGLTALGVTLVPFPHEDGSTVYHVFDIIGREHYKYPLDWVEECLLPDEPVFTAEGMKPIGEIREGDLVLTHKGRFRPVLSTMRHRHKGEMVSIRTLFWNQPLCATANHPVLRAKATRGRKLHKETRRFGTRIEDIDFVPAGEIQPGDYLCYPIPYDVADVESVTMTYTVTYSEFSNSLRTPEVVRAVKHRRTFLTGSVSRHQYTILSRLEPGITYSYAKILKLSGDVYAHASGLAQSLSNLVAKGLLRKPAQSCYLLSDEGRKVAESRYETLEGIANALGISASTVRKALNPPARKRDRATRVPLERPLLRIIGYYLAEGSVANTTKNGQKDYWCAVEFSFGKGDMELGYAAEIMEAAEMLGWNARYSVKEECHHVVIDSRHLAHWLVENFGKGAAGKRLPAWFLTLPYEKQREALRAWLYGDGYHHNGHWNGTTVSSHMAVGWMLVGNRLGYRVSVRRNEPGHAFGYQGQPIYLITFGESTKQNRVFTDGGYIFLPVIRAARIGYVGDVCNLEVAEDETYCTTYHTVHNCRRLGISRLISVETDFSKLTEDSLYVPLHAWGTIENAPALHWAVEAAGQVMRECPRGVHKLLDETMCIRLWRHLYGKRDTEERKGMISAWRARVMPSFEYEVEVCPEGFTPEYSLAILGAFPISGLEIVRDPDGGTHEKAVEATKAARRNGIGVQLVDL